LIEAEGTRLLRDQRLEENPQELATRRLHYRPAESECLQRKSTCRKYTALPMSLLKPIIKLISLLIAAEINPAG
jgi:hypothetical protein